MIRPSDLEVAYRKLSSLLFDAIERMSPAIYDVQVQVVEVHASTAKELRQIWRRVWWDLIGHGKRIKVQVLKVTIGKEDKMTDAECHVLEDMILRVALQRDPANVRRFAGGWTEQGDKNGGLADGVADAYEALSIARQTRAAIEARFDLFTAKIIRDL